MPLNMNQQMRSWSRKESEVVGRNESYNHCQRGVFCRQVNGAIVHKLSGCQACGPINLPVWHRRSMARKDLFRELDPHKFVFSPSLDILDLRVFINVKCKIPSLEVISNYNW